MAYKYGFGQSYGGVFTWHDSLSLAKKDAAEWAVNNAYEASQRNTCIFRKTAKKYAEEMIIGIVTVNGSKVPFYHALYTPLTREEFRKTNVSLHIKSITRINAGTSKTEKIIGKGEIHYGDDIVAVYGPSGHLDYMGKLDFTEYRRDRWTYNREKKRYEHTHDGKRYIMIRVI